MFNTVSTDLPLNPYPCSELDPDPYEDQGSPLYWETGVRQVSTESDRKAFEDRVKHLRKPDVHWRQCVGPSMERILQEMLKLLRGGWFSFRASYRKLASKSGLDASTVQRQLENAEEIGLVAHVPHGHPTHFNASNEWVLLNPTEDQMGSRRLPRERQAQRAFLAELNASSLGTTEVDQTRSDPSPAVDNQQQVRQNAQQTSSESIISNLLLNVGPVEKWDEEDAREDQEEDQQLQNTIKSSKSPADEAAEADSLEGIDREAAMERPALPLPPPGARHSTLEQYQQWLTELGLGGMGPLH